MTGVNRIHRPSSACLFVPGNFSPCLLHASLVTTVLPRADALTVLPRAAVILLLFCCYFAVICHHEGPCQLLHPMDRRLLLFIFVVLGKYIKQRGFQTLYDRVTEKGPLKPLLSALTKMHVHGIFDLSSLFLTSRV